MQGPLKQIKALRGKGRLDLIEGNIWEINLLQGLGSFLFIPEFSKIVLQEAHGDFVVDQGMIYTSNLELKSDRMNLICSGNIDFSGKLNFDISGELNPELLQNSASVKKFFTAFLADSTGAVALKLSGDVHNPKYRLIPPTGDIIKRVTDFFTKDILR